MDLKGRMDGRVLDSRESGQGQMARCRSNGGKLTGSKINLDKLKNY